MEENDQATIDGCVDANSRKRPRKKYLYSQILQQMEFYFSDANLARDRYLSKLLEKNKNVPLDVFLRFNKLRALTTNTVEIAKALGTSELLKVTEDGKHVFRTRKVQKKENQEDCTIYVEQLPPDANHDWVKGIFSSYGKVEYVSIPKYKTRAAIKGFAFVEFDTPEAAKQALEAFGSAGCCLPPQLAPEELCSVATFEVDKSENQEDSQKTEHKVENLSIKNKKIKAEGIDESSGSELMQTENVEEEEEDEIREPKLKKLKPDTGGFKTGEKQKKKKGKDKFDSENAVAESEAVETAKNKKGKKRKLENGNNGSMSDSVRFCIEGGNSNDTVSKKKNKKPKHDEGGSDEVQNETDEMEEENDVNLNAQVTKKKNKMKKKDHKDEENDDDGDISVENTEDEGTSERTKNQTEDDDNGEEAGANSGKSNEKKRARKRNKSKQKRTEKKESDPTSLGLRIISKNEWRRLRNKYLNLQREKMQGLKKHLARAKFGSNYQSPFQAKESKPREAKNEPQPKSKKTKYIPGVIVHVDMGEPLGEVNSFKNNARTEQGVMYVDVNEGGSEAYIRCNSAELAQTLVGKKLWNNMKILEGEAEELYWKKIWADRECKIQGKARGIKARGRDKLLKRAERELGKHIKFDN